MNPEQRKRVFERDGRECRNCGTKQSATELHAHHIVPLSLSGEDTISNCVTLCDECHKTVHGLEHRGTMHGEMISEAINQQQQNGDYHHGPAPLGFVKDDGELVEADNYERVVEVLDMVAKGEESQRQAAKELDTSRRTIRRAVEERAELYGL